MAKRKKYKAEDFPPAGTVFAMPLADGRVGVCRVVRFLGEGRNAPSALVAASDWISDSAPQLSDPAVRRILLLNHHGWKSSPEAHWVSQPPPRHFQVLGQIEVSQQDADFESNSFGGWESFALQVLLQWRWDHDREALLAEDGAKKEIELSKQAAIQQTRTAYLSSISFAELQARKLFPTWDEFPPEAAKKGCERIMLSLIGTLAVQAKPLDRAFVSGELQKCVESLNEFDSENNNFITTIEREDLILVLEEILNAAQFPDLVDDIDNWRDW